MSRKRKNKYPPGVGREFINHCWRHNARMGQLRFTHRVLYEMSMSPSFTSDDRAEAARLAEGIMGLLSKASIRRNDEQFKRKELK